MLYLSIIDVNNNYNNLREPDNGAMVIHSRVPWEGTTVALPSLVKKKNTLLGIE